MPRARSVSLRQLDELLKLMEGDRNMANARMAGGPLGHQRVQRFWVDVAERLNCLPDGTNKFAGQWKTYWHDLKYRARKRAAAVRRHAAGTGGGPSIRALTATESRILNILGTESYEGNPSVQIPFHLNDNSPQAAGSSQPAASTSSNQLVTQQSPTPPSPSPSPPAPVRNPGSPPVYLPVDSDEEPAPQHAPRVRRRQNNSADPPRWARQYEERRLAIDAQRQLAQERLAISQEKIAELFSRLLDKITPLMRIPALLEDLIQIHRQMYDNE